MQQSDQESYPYQTDEIDLRKLFISLFARKLFIFSLTGFITLLSVIYSLNLTPIYKVTTSVTSPSDKSMLHINRLPLTSENYKLVFSKFISLLSSRDFQTKVFLDGDYLTALNPENKPINDVTDYTLDFLSSISIEFVFNNTKQSLLEEPHSISMEGGSGEIISRYLNALVIAADNKTITELISLVEHKIDLRLVDISLERDLLLVKARQQRLNEIEVLTHASKIARTLGITESNFTLISDDVIDANFRLTLGVNNELPQWYLYGEKALLERIKLLQGRTNDEPFIGGLIDLNTEKLKLESFVIDPSGINSMQQVLSAIIPKSPIQPNKRLIVLLAFIGSFMMSILLALVMNALKPDELTPPE